MNRICSLIWQKMTNNQLEISRMLRQQWNIEVKTYYVISMFLLSNICDFSPLFCDSLRRSNKFQCQWKPTSTIPYQLHHCPYQPPPLLPQQWPGTMAPGAFDCCHYNWHLAAAWGLMTPTGNSCLVVLDPRSNTRSSHFQFCSMMLQKAWPPSSKQQHEMMPAAWMPVVGTTAATATNNITSYNNQPWDSNINLMATAVVGGISVNGESNREQQQIGKAKV